MTTTTTNYQVTRETEDVFRNIRLDGVKTLNVDRVSITWDVKYLLDHKGKPVKIVEKYQSDTQVKKMSFELVEVSPDELRTKRKRFPSFVLKVDGKFFYASVPVDLNITPNNILGPHKCALTGCECRRLSAASDSDGGCEKVRDDFNSERIEKYPWITTGYQTLGTRHDCFVVIDCEHYKSCPPRKTARVGNAAKVAHAQVVWEDVSSLEKWNQYIRKNQLTTNNT